MNLESLYALAYRVFGDVSEKLTDLLSGLSGNVRRSYMLVGPSSYISLMLLVSAIAGSASFVAVMATGLLVLGLPLLATVCLALAALGGAVLLVFGVFYAYPALRVRRMRAELERDLPFIASYMAVMASAGVSPYEMFKSLARGDVIPSITPIAATIIRDVELLGFDALAAIIRAASLSPSLRLRAFFDGIVATIHTGSDLAAYLRGAMEEALRTQRVRLREMAETLSVFGEAFVSFFVAGPIFITIMLTLMALLGGVGGLNPVILLSLIIYLLMPIGGLGMLLVAKALTPGE